jgi:hypothetical protein
MFLKRVVPGPHDVVPPQRHSLVKGASATAKLLALLPRLRVRLTADPAGERLHAHFSHRLWGIRHCRLAQGVLVLPDEQGRYARGRSRQAVRTNMRKAVAVGISCHPLGTARERSAAWRSVGLGVSNVEDDHFSLPGDRWWGAFASDGQPVAIARATVDREIALLQTFVSSHRPSRYLLHTELVEDLVGIEVRYVVANAPMAPLLEPSLQYWQRLLGYQVANLLVSRSPLARKSSLLGDGEVELAVSASRELSA